MDYSVAISKREEVLRNLNLIRNDYPSCLRCGKSIHDPDNHSGICSVCLLKIPKPRKTPSKPQVSSLRNQHGGLHLVPCKTPGCRFRLRQATQGGYCQACKNKIRSPKEGIRINCAKLQQIKRDLKRLLDPKRTSVDPGFLFRIQERVALGVSYPTTPYVTIPEPHLLQLFDHLAKAEVSTTWEDFLFHTQEAATVLQSVKYK